MLEFTPFIVLYFFNSFVLEILLSFPSPLPSLTSPSSIPHFSILHPSLLHPPSLTSLSSIPHFSILHPSLLHPRSLTSTSSIPNFSIFHPSLLRPILHPSLLRPPFLTTPSLILYLRLTYLSY